MGNSLNAHCPHCEHCKAVAKAEAMIGKRVRLLVNGVRGKHKGKFGKIVRYPEGYAQYRNIFMIQVGDYQGPYHINQFKQLSISRKP